MHAADDPLVLDVGDDGAARSCAVGGGLAVAYSRVSPDKTTDNEDTVALMSFGPGAAVFAIADGAGGQPAGKRASLLAVRTLIDALQESFGRTMLLRTAVLNGIDAANAAVLGLANGSATTLTVVTVEGRSVRCYQVGDSEAIVVGQRGLVRLQTLAQSPTGYAVEAGFLDQRAALHHEERHLVSNFVGSADMRIDIGPPLEMQAMDTLLIASDGLTDNLHLGEIVERMRKGPLDDGASRLAGLAAERMRRDPGSAVPSKPDDLSLILFRKPATARGPA